MWLQTKCEVGAGLNAYAHRFFLGKGEEGSIRCFILQFPPSSQPWRQEAFSTPSTRFPEWEGAQETRTPLLFSREVGKAEGLSLDRFWSGRHLPMMTAPPSCTNPSTSRQASVAVGLPRPPPP